MKRKYSLKENHMFSKVYRRGRFFSAPLVVVYALKNYKTAAPAKIGFSVSAKHGGAVSRNRAKRLMREALRVLYPSLRIGFIYVISARAPLYSKNIKSPAVLADVKKCLRRLDLIKEND